MTHEKSHIKANGKTGLFPEHDGIGPIVREVSATIPVIEALREAGARMEPLWPEGGYRVTLPARLPEGIIASIVRLSPNIGLRMDNEPEWPMEHPDVWVQLEWTPCPTCGAPLVWYEAGYVPGYRVCAQPPHHHVLAR